MSWLHSALSKGIEALISRMIALGPSANLPPHIWLPLGALPDGACAGDPLELSVVFRSLLTLLALALAVGACDREAGPAAQQEENSSPAKQELSGEIDRSQSGTLLPALLLSDPAGHQINLGAVQGTPVLVNLWATWCAPCVVEMPMLDNLADTMGDELRVITISQDLQGAKRVEPFFAKNDFRNLQPWLDPENEAAKAFGDAGMPITVLFDSSGQEIFRVTGGYHWDSEDAIALVREALQ